MKRKLNHATAAEGLLVAQMSSNPDKATAMDAFCVAAPESNSDSDCSRSSENGNSKSAGRQGVSEVALSQGGLQTPTKKQRTGFGRENEEEKEDIPDDDSDAGTSLLRQRLFRRIAIRSSTESRCTLWAI